MKTFISIFTLVFLISCGPSNSIPSKLDAFLSMLNNQAGGWTYKVVKETTIRGGDWVVFEKIHNDGLKEYQAYDMALYQIGQTASEWNLVHKTTLMDPIETDIGLAATDAEKETLFLDYLAARPFTVIKDLNYDANTNTYSIDETKLENIVATYYSNLNPVDTLNTLKNLTTFSQEDSASKDLEKLGSSIEMIEAENLSENLVLRFGLSEDRAQKIAKISNAYLKVQNKRSLTDREKDSFTREILGFGYHAGKKALENHLQGNGSELEALIQEAAIKNETSPEAITEFLGEFLLK